MKGEGFLQQCPNKKKEGNFCGKHADCKNPFTNLLTIKPQEAKKTPVEVIQSKDVGINISTVSAISSISAVSAVSAVSDTLVFDKDRYKNKTDFYSFDDIETIPLEFFYEHKEGNQYFAFDIRTLHDYIASCNPLEPIKNPYTHVDFSNETIEHIKKYHKKISKSIVASEYKEELKLSPEKQLEWRALEVFQKINELGHYAEYKWFWDLNLFQLKSMYIELEDLWNYRLFLTTQQKQKILPQYYPFIQYSVSIFNKINNLHDARKILVGEIERFVTLGKAEGKNGNDNKYTGSIIVLTALVQISKYAAEGLPHLVPIVD
jgi:hypothetical protein